MRKVVLFIAVLLFMAVPAMATTNVTITCEPNNANHWVTVDYDTHSDANLIRAFGLDITVDTNRITQLDVCEPNYRIYPGQISIVNNDVNSYGTPYDPCDLGDANLTIEMGSLYTMDTNYMGGDPNMGYGKKPGKSGRLLKFYVAGDCNYKVDVNVLRGGIVMEDPYDQLSLTSPLCSGHVGGGGGIIQYYDFGDAPQSYSTKLADVPAGPRHLMAGPTTGVGPILGALIDAEADGQPIPPFFGDDVTGLADEDGIVGLTAVVNEGGNVTVNVSQAAGVLNAWIDWGNDGSFAQVGDQIFTNQPVAIGPNPLAFAVPAGAVKNTPLASRWRVTSTSEPLPTGRYYGDASSGEVEDYNKPTVVCHVPNVVNMKLVDANTLIQNQGLAIGTITYECNSVIHDGNVLRTNPVYCNYPNCGTTVDIWVSLNPPLPGAAFGPTPVAGVNCVNQTQILGWTPGAGTVTQDIYFGTTNPPPQVASGVPVGTTTYNPGTMPVYTLHYWRIDEKNACGGTTTGTVWCFATGAKMVSGVQKPCCLACLGNLNTDTFVNNTDLSLLVAFIGGLPNNRCTTVAGSGTCPPCYDINGDGTINNTDSAVLISKIAGWANNRHKCPYPSCTSPP